MNEQEIKKAADELVNEFIHLTNEIEVDGDVISVGYLEKPTATRIAKIVVKKQIEAMQESYEAHFGKQINYQATSISSKIIRKKKAILKELKSRL